MAKNLINNTPEYEIAFRAVGENSILIEFRGWHICIKRIENVWICRTHRIGWVSEYSPQSSERPYWNLLYDIEFQRPYFTNLYKAIYYGIFSVMIIAPENMVLKALVEIRDKKLITQKELQKIGYYMRIDLLNLTFYKQNC